jgi:nucleotide-binding universal stress UspA family protein
VLFRSTLQRIFAGHPPLAERELAQSARRALEATAAAARSRRGVDVECRITVGAVAAKIARQAQSGAADVIVIGAHGENFVREILLGTTAEKVVRAASPMRGSSATGKSRAVRPGAK